MKIEKILIDIETAKEIRKLEKLRASIRKVIRKKLGTEAQIKIQIRYREE